MFTLGPLGFTVPWLLLALVALPVLWLLLRAVPPAPIRRRFPGVALLLGRADEAQVAERTPWWLLLLRMLAQQTGLAPGELVWMGADVHLYLNHAHLVETQLQREPRPFPKLQLKPAPNLFAYTLEHVEISGYDPHPHISAPVAV